MEQKQNNEQNTGAQSRGERSSELYSRDDLQRIDRVLHQPNYAPERKPFSVWKLLGIFFGVLTVLSSLAWVSANLLL